MRSCMILLCAFTLAGTGGLHAASCTVPGSHASIQAAIDAPACDPIQIGPGEYLESLRVARSLTLVGAGSSMTTLRGRFEVEGSGVLVLTDALRIDSGCTGSAGLVHAGATLTGEDLRVVRTSGAACGAGARIFADGFE